MKNVHVLRQIRLYNSTTYGKGNGKPKLQTSLSRDYNFGFTNLKIKNKKKFGRVQAFEMCSIHNRSRLLRCFLGKQHFFTRPLMRPERKLIKFQEFSFLFVFSHFKFNSKFHLRNDFQHAKKAFSVISCYFFRMSVRSLKTILDI